MFLNLIDPTAILSFNPSGPTGTGLETAGSYLSLILIFAAFGLIATLSMRSRTVSSFQFELYVFVLIVVMAEVPAILINLGFLPALAQYELDGLIVHSISMAFLSAFILWRAFKAFGTKKSGAEKRSLKPKEVEEPKAKTIGKPLP
jgi:hypothetical protein